MVTMRPRHRLGALAVVAGLFLSACGSSTPSKPPIRIGAVFPMSGTTAGLAGEEQASFRLAADFANADGGVAGRAIQIIPENLSSPADADHAVAALAAQGVSIVVGAYSSDLSMAASAAAARHGMVYWEAGAVADQVTGRGLPGVFRVGATGSNLGSNSLTFAASQLAPALHRDPHALTVSLVVANDEYAHSVADAARATALANGMRVISESDYNPYAPQFGAAISTLASAKPDLLVLASHIPDGVAFRRAFLAAGLHVGAFVGSTMAQCMPDFGNELGQDAVGVFASDRPGYGFDPSKLPPTARAIFTRFATSWETSHQDDPDEEAISGFSAGWALFRDVLPRASNPDDPTAVSKAAMGVDLPEGSLPNGAGLKFSSQQSRLGQNLRASAVVWQWQAVRKEIVVWPAQYANGSLNMVPLPR